MPGLAKYLLTIRVSSRGSEMAAKLSTTMKIRGLTQDSIVYEVVRPQRGRVSRYKLKKQAHLVQEIMSDPTVMQL